MQSIMRDQVYQHLAVYNLLTQNQQHGFISGKSCLTQIFYAMNYWTTSLDQNIPVDILSRDLDFQKAFDSVPHYHLLLSWKLMVLEPVTLALD